MAFEKQAQLVGDTRIFAVHPKVKKYALMDTGFLQQKNGSFQLLRQLEPDKSFEESFKLKIVFAKDLSGFKLKTVNSLGNTVVNVFKHDRQIKMVEQLDYYLNELVNREILLEIN
ncbi:cysteine desulfurase [Periweissella beninensis]|uniref:Cysteine desulfurase n=1 Tax=Periweissella beninensis TaxID=504936 RepID=A0ABT0VFQ5_9LACO|nr:cysteine desulfurase [Periweissella beninensis]MBM7543549.1 hypothetical protein [Periweissella beninensis]MCM2436531.1 cysteine desulfurase [Periweissella beninensis]MCT4396248.1 cysteine desulfurase [Periweissella beninensis]